MLRMIDDDFSVIALRKGTVCGYSPRMRYDLIINTMFKCAMQDGVIRANNPGIWRPFLSIDDAAMAYTRVIEAHPALSGIFNIASGNHTVGEIGDLVKLAIEEHWGNKIGLEIQHIADVRNYKVSIRLAETVLSFHLHHSVKSIVRNLIENMDQCGDWDNPAYSNIKVFKKLETASPASAQPVKEEARA